MAKSSRAWEPLDATSRSVAAAVNVADAATLDIRGFAGMQVTAVSGSGTLTIWGCDSPNGTFKAIERDNTDLTVAAKDNKWTVVDENVFSSHFIRFVGATLTLNFILKG